MCLLQEEPDQYHLKEGNVLKAESVLRQLAPPDEWCDSASAPQDSDSGCIRTSCLMPG